MKDQVFTHYILGSHMNKGSRLKNTSRELVNMFNLKHSCLARKQVTGLFVSPIPMQR